MADTTDYSGFVSNNLPLAQKISSDTGLPVDYVLGQMGNESQWGTSPAAKNNNLWGITDPKTGQPAAYASPEEGAAAYTALMNGRYAKVPRTGSPTQIASAMAGAGYNPLGNEYGRRIGNAASLVTPLLPKVAPPSDVDAFLKAPPSTPPTIAPSASGTPPGDVDQFLAAPPAATPATPPAAAPAVPGTPPPATVQPGTSAPPAPTAGVPAGRYVPSSFTNAAAGFNRGLTSVQSVADAADAWLGQNVPGYKSLETKLGPAVVPGAQASAADQARAQDLDAKYGGGVAYWLGKMGGQYVGTLPLAGPLGAAGGRVLGWLGDLVGPTTARVGTAIGEGAGSGAGFNALTGGVNEDPTSNALTNLATGALGGGVFGGMGSIVGTGASRLMGGVGTALENTAERLGIPLSRGERLGGPALSIEDASSGLPFSGAARLAGQKNAAFSRIIANEAGIPGPVQNITTPMLNTAETAAGQRIENAAAGVTMPYDNALMTRLGQIESDAARLGTNTPGHNVARSLNNDLLSIASQNGGTIPGPNFQDFIRRGSTFDNMLKSTDPAVRDVARQFQGALYDQAANSGRGSADALADMQLGRRQWKAIQSVRPVIDRTVAGSEEMSPQRLATSIMNNYDMSYSGAGNDMQDLARVINATRPLPSSGTAERLQRQRLWTAGIGLGAGGAGGAALYAYDPNAAADAATALPALAGLSLAGRFSRLGMPGGAAYLPRLVAGPLGNRLLPQPPQLNQLTGPAP